ncbi:MAG: hypothetical protein QOE60_2982 [Thermoleophilaceae bacterium]|nr:hypothetical protein [Thermoleophilaceae bacterium]
MRWLLTTPAEVDLETVRREVEKAGGALETDEPVPLGDSEQALYAEGPDDLHERLASTPEVVKVSPHSDPQPY